MFSSFLLPAVHEKLEYDNTHILGPLDSTAMCTVHDPRPVQRISASKPRVSEGRRECENQKNRRGERRSGERAKKDDALHGAMSACFLFNFGSGVAGLLPAHGGYGYAGLQRRPWHGEVTAMYCTVSTACFAVRCCSDHITP